MEISKNVKKYILTSNYSLKNAKPSPYCFLKICDLENAAKMYSYSYDYCMDKSVELYEKISKEQK